jgi:diguanylate cyclase (GGDEF)-like protein
MTATGPEVVEHRARHALGGWSCARSVAACGGRKPDGPSSRWVGLRRCVGVLLLLLLTLPIVHAAQRFGQERGLPSQSIEALALDDRGFLWVGTLDGLVRFDSHRFLPLDLGYGRGLTDPKVTRLLALRDAVYVATPRRLHRYDQRSATLAPVLDGDVDIGGIIDLVQDVDGSVLAVTSAGRLYRWHDAAAPSPRALALVAEVPLPSVATLAVGADALWLGTARGVYRIDRASLRVEPLRLPLPEIDDGAVPVRALHAEAGGELWIGFWNDGLARYRPAERRIDRLLPGDARAGALRSTSIYRFHSAADALYIGTNRGLVVYRRGCDCLRGLNHPDWDEIEGRGVVISDLAVEPSGAVWAGSWGTGLVRFSATDQAIERQVRVDGRTDALAHPTITTLHVDPNARLWIGSYGGGLQWVDAAQRRVGEFWPLQSVPWGTRRIETRFIWALSGDATALQIGAGIGLFGWSEDAPALQDLAPDLSSVRSLLPLDRDSLLVGTMFGLQRRRGDVIEPLTLRTTQELPASAHAIWSLARRGDEIWAGSGSGLWRLDRNLSVLAHHDVGTGDATLPGAVVWTQKTDAQGRHWLGTSGGLVEAIGRGDALRFVRHAHAEPGASQSVVSIEVDRQGTLWLGTPRGLVRYRAQDGSRRLLDSHDGLISDQLHSNASTADGERLYFGGIGGVIAFDPLAIPASDTSLRPQLVQLRLGQGAWQAPGALTLAHDHPSLHAELSAFHFEHPAQVRYAYRWAPEEAAFTELGDARSAVFSRLPSGAHRLELRAWLTQDPAVVATAEVLQVTVLPAWHQTWWGRVAVLAGVLLLAYAIFALRSRQIRQQAQALAQQVRERTHQLSAAKDELERANEKLQRLADTDPLTGLANRRHLFEVAARWQDEGHALAALLIDLDHFKRINDERGHAAGDAVLVDFAEVMRTTIEGHALCVRYGGEEFLILRRDSTQPAPEVLADALLQQIRRRRLDWVRGGALHYTASIGIARGTPGEPIEILIRRADQALYRAKAAGRDRREAG